jgi:raffinose/stachyose/melibiose transport system substrate-binding protein
MFSYANVDSVGAAPAIANGHFLKEESAIYTNGSWRLAPSQKDGPAVFDNLAFDYLPSFGNYPGSVPMFLQAMLAAGETKDPARRAAIITFLKVLTSPDNVKKISLASGAMFTVPFTFQAATPVEKGMQRFMELVQKAKFTVPNLEVALGPAAVAEFGQLISKYVAGDTTEAAMLSAIAKKLED